jgi:hypothetical protein
MVAKQYHARRVVIKGYHLQKAEYGPSVVVVSISRTHSPKRAKENSEITFSIVWLAL